MSFYDPKNCPEDPSHFFPGERCFKQLAPSIFQISAEFGGNTISATGFSLAILSKEQRLVLGTAAHVVSKLPRDQDVRWTVQQFDVTGREVRKIHFTSNEAKTGASPFHYGLKWDVAALALPAR